MKDDPEFDKIIINIWFINMIYNWDFNKMLQTLEHNMNTLTIVHIRIQVYSPSRMQIEHTGSQLKLHHSKTSSLDLIK
jgi:hypothetical protein